MSRQVFTVSPTDTAQSVARLMAETGVGAVPVETPGVGTILGIVTDRDIVTSVVAQGLSSSTAVFEFMTVAAESCEEDDSLLLAAQKMHDLRDPTSRRRQREATRGRHRGSWGHQPGQSGTRRSRSRGDQPACPPSIPSLKECRHADAGSSLERSGDSGGR
ncbi:CBS domain-containing protein (plasmid) [Sinorhizobium meliloti]|nr:CBS domain-containing protein [Sinorhizobium meliloti]